MIRRTFQLVRGIGPFLERDLWSRGLTTWESLLAAGETALSRPLFSRAQVRLQEALSALEARDLRSLAQLFPSRERWRLYREFASKAVFFDIETDGSAVQTPTVVSLFHAQGLEIFIQGRNLHQLPQALARWPLWVTFNGTGFDVPVLASHFSDFPRPEMHLDLRYVCHRLKLRGGLKKIEDQLGFSRPPHMHGVNGLDAVYLWRDFCETADIEKLRFLVEYNLYDTVQLRTLAETTFNKAVEELGFEDRLPVFDRGEILYDLTRSLMKL